MCVAAAAIPAVTLAISAASAVASVGMGIMSAQQQSAQAQASMNMQAKQQQLQQQQQRQSMVQSQQQQRQSMEQQRSQQIAQMTLQDRQNQQSYNLQVQQSNQQIANQYSQQQQQVEAERTQIQKKYASDRLTYQRSTEQASEQKRFNNEAANRMYVQEQSKISEAKKKAAFARQASLAKSIGAQGAILSSGRTGQSVGLLVNDAQRQAGFEEAQALATMDSTVEQSQIGMDSAFIQNASANQQADNQVGFNPESPYMPSMPGIPEFIDPYSQDFA